MGDETIKALDSVNLDIEKGELISIIGPSDSGKTTLANIIGGLDKPDQGYVVFDLVDLSKAKDAKLSEYRNKKVVSFFRILFFNQTIRRLKMSKSL